jgi:hypothetical protein
MNFKEGQKVYLKAEMDNLTGHAEIIKVGYKYIHCKLPNEIIVKFYRDTHRQLKNGDCEFRLYESKQAYLDYVAFLELSKDIKQLLDDGSLPSTSEIKEFLNLCDKYF